MTLTLLHIAHPEGKGGGGGSLFAIVVKYSSMENEVVEQLRNDNQFMLTNYININVLQHHLTLYASWSEFIRRDRSRHSPILPYHVNPLVL